MAAPSVGETPRPLPSRKRVRRDGGIRLSSWVCTGLDGRGSVVGRGLGDADETGRNRIGCWGMQQSMMQGRD